MHAVADDSFSTDDDVGHAGRKLMRAAEACVV